MKRHPILTFLRLVSNSLAALAALMVGLFMVRRWFFLLAVWSARPQTAEVSGEAPLRTTLAVWPMVLLLVPFRNEAAVLPTLLIHLSQLDYPTEQLTMVLIDDGSMDNSPQLAQSWVQAAPRRHLLTLPQTGGKAAALNAALAHFAQGELVAVYDADERPLPSALAHLAACFADESVGAVNGRRAISNPLASIFASYSTIENLVHQTVTMQAKERLALAPAILGSNCVYRRRALLDAGSFLVDALLEDSDLSLKLAAAGWQTRFCPQAISTHAVPQTLTGHWRQHRRWSSGFRTLARQQVVPILTNGKLSWRMRLELLSFSMGYVDRAAWLMLGMWVTGKTAVSHRPPFLFLTILLMSLITPLFQVMVALRQAHAPAALWWRVWLLPLLLSLDIVISLVGMLLKRAAWETRETA